MKKVYFILFSFFTLSAWAQETLLPKQFVTAGLGAGYADKITLISTPVVYHHQILAEGLYLTAGLRQNIGYGSKIFTINGKDALIDDMSNYGLNILIGAEYAYEKILIGGNIDLVGLNIGTRGYKTVGSDPVYTIKPDAYNLILSKGCLNNEAYLGYKVSPSLTVKFGVSVYTMSLLYSNTQTAEKASTTYSLLPILKMDYRLWEKN